MRYLESGTERFRALGIHSAGDDSILSLLLRSRSCSEYSLHFLMGGLALGYYYCGRQLGLRSSLKVWSTLWVGTS
jgi:hypothetical protein